MFWVLGTAYPDPAEPTKSFVSERSEQYPFEVGVNNDGSGAMGS